MLLLSASASSLSSSAPHRIAGVLQSTDDLDHYRVELVAGQRYFFDMQSQHPLGLVLQDANGDLLVSGIGTVSSVADAPDLWTASLSFVAPHSATYLLQASSYPMWRSADPVHQDYVLSVGSIALDDVADLATQARLITPGSIVSGVLDVAQDSDWFRLPMTAGQRVHVAIGSPEPADVEVRIVAPDGSEWLPTRAMGSTFILSAANAGDYRIELRFAEGGYVPGDVSQATYNIVTERLSADDHAELRSAATRLTLGQATSGSIELSGDSDWFRVELTAGQRYTVDASSDFFHTLGLVLTDATGQVLRQSDSAHGLRFDAPATGSYYLRPTGGDYLPEWREPVDYQLTVRQTPKDDHADTATGATPLALGGSASFSLDGRSDIDVFRFDAVAGQRYRVQLGDPSGYASTDLVFAGPGQTLPATPGPRFYEAGTTIRDWYYTADTTGPVQLAALPRDYGGTAAWTLSLAAVAADDHAESAAAATALALGASRTGRLDGAGDRDLFAVQLAAGEHYRAELRSVTDDTSGSAWFQGFTPTLTVTASGSDEAVAVVTGFHNARWSSVQFTAPAAGLYRVQPTWVGDYELRVGTLPPPGDDEATGIWLDASAAFEPTGALLIGTDGPDTLSGGLRGDVLSGGAGRDKLFGNAGDDKLDGGADDDDLYGRAGRDTLDGGAGDDRLDSGDDDDTLSGSDGNDVLDGGSGNDRLDGGPGRDLMSGTYGDDFIDGGDGIDFFLDLNVPSSGTVRRTETGWTVTDRVNGNGTDTLVNVERLQFQTHWLALDVEGAAGQVAKIIGALFGESLLADRTLVGLGLSLRDAGVSYADLVAAAVGIDLFWAQTSAGRTDAAFVDIVYRHVVGQPPTAAEAAPYVAMLVDGSATRAELAMLACEHPLNAIHIDLVGLMQTGIEYIAAG